MRTLTVPAVLSLAVGVLLVPLKFIYSFFPLFNLVDIALFGLVGRYFGKRWPTAWWTTALLLSLPSLGLVAWILRNLSVSDLLAGVGTGWAASGLLVPVAAIGGAYVGQRRGRLND
jgi:hypothetical protein